MQYVRTRTSSAAEGSMWSGSQDLDSGLAVGDEVCIFLLYPIYR